MEKHSDPTDTATDLEAKFQAESLEKHRQQAQQHKRPDAKGYCLSCNEDFEDENDQRLFCDRKCAMNYDG